MKGRMEGGRKRVDQGKRMGERQDWLPVCSASALAVDWNRVVLNQMLHTFLTFLREDRRIEGER